MSKPRFLSALVFAVFVSLLGIEPAHAQGIQPFSTQAPGPNTSVDLASSNIFLTIPIRGKVGAIPFQYVLIGNQSPYYGFGGLSGTWTGPGASATYYSNSQTSYNCGARGSGETYTWEGNWNVVDSTGAYHPLPTSDGIYSSEYTDTNCKNSGSFSDMTTDGSGYTLSVQVVGLGGQFTASITDRSGNQVSTLKSVDPNGNSIAISYSNGNSIYTDTLGQVAMTQSNNLPFNYWYTDQNGNMQEYSVGTSSLHVKTNFTGNYPYCSPNLDYNPEKLPTSLTQNATGQQYVITYEPTPGYPGDVTGRIQQITFPSGGYVKYTYSGGSNGINCNTGVVPTITKTVSDGNGNVSTWTYVNNSNALQSAFTVTETDPAGNQTVYTFWGEYQLEKQAYQGTTSSGSLLSTTVTCYNGNFANCNTTNPLSNGALQITQTDVFTYPQGSTSASLVETKYNSTGTVAEVKKYDFGAATSLPPTGAPATSPISDTTISYDGPSGPCGTLSAPIHDRPCSVTVGGPSGVVSQTDYTYNSTGHPIQTSRLVSGSSYLTSAATYNANGTIANSTEPNGTVTTYSYNGTGACNGLLPTSTSAGGLSTSQTWDCNGGVLTSTTDANGQTTSYGYQTSGGTADPFWRVLSVTDPLGNATRSTYSALAPFTKETSLQFNGSASGSDVLTTYDGLNRPIFVQTRQAPGSTTFDSVQTTYGWTSNTGPFTTTSVPYSGAQGQAAPGGTAVTKNQSDAIGRASTIVDGGGGTTTYSYTSRDTLITLSPAPTGENTKRRQFEYDGLGRLTSVCELTAGTAAWPGGTCSQSSSQTGYWTKYTYNPLGSLLTVTQNAQSSSNQQTRTYTYDDLQRLTSENNPETGINQYFWDQAPAACGGSGWATPGDLGAKENNSGTYSCFGYDGLHRLLGSVNTGSLNCRGYI